MDTNTYHLSIWHTQRPDFRRSLGSGPCSSLRRGRSTDSFPEQQLVIEPNISLDQKDTKNYTVNTYKINDMPMLDSSIIWTHSPDPMESALKGINCATTWMTQLIKQTNCKQILTTRDKRDTDYSLTPLIGWHWSNQQRELLNNHFTKCQEKLYSAIYGRPTESETYPILKKTVF